MVRLAGAEPALGLEVLDGQCRGGQLGGMRDGFLTVETVESLRARLPSLGELPDPARVTPKDLFGLLTVERSATSWSPD